MKFQCSNSPNFDKRKYRKIKYLIIHYTGMLSSAESLKRLQSKKAKVSSHYFINEYGKIIQLVKDHNIAWHAGISKYKDRQNCNDFSIGIELEGTSKSEFTDNQYDSLNTIILCLKDFYPKIVDKNIIGHNEVSPDRKDDPGPYFKWNR